MSKFTILIGAVAAIVGATSASAALPERLAIAPAMARSCTPAGCAISLPVACRIDPARASMAACEHSARDIEELGQQQLDQLIESLD